MLTADHHHPRAAEVDGISNYYEGMVRTELGHQLEGSTHDPDLLADMACVALNHLPPRYVRHAVDMAFYLSPREQEEMEQKVAAAVRDAIVFVRQRGDNRR